MSRKTHSEIYPQPLVLPPASLADKNREPYVQVVTHGDVGDGIDGDLTVIENTVVNKYAGLNNNNTLDYPIGSTVLHVDTDAVITDFSVGQEIMIIQMQTYRSGDLGQYEYVKIDSIAGNEITLTTGLTHKYYSDDDGNKHNNTKTQIVSIPHYTSVDIQSGFNIIATPWNGYRGGIVAFRCQGNISGNGGINVDQAGYRGGYWYGDGHTSWSHQAEGYYGSYGSGHDENYGGAGDYGSAGGHATAGSGATGGRAFGTDDLLHELTFGGGGHKNGGNRTSEAAAGAGIIMISTSGIDITGQISAKGIQNTWCAGSAGGSIVIMGVDASALSISVDGIAGGSSGFYQNYVSVPPEISIKYRDRMQPYTPDPNQLLLPPADVSSKNKVPYVAMTSYGDVGDGRDGDLNVSTDIIVNSYAGVTQDMPVGTMVVYVDTVTGFNVDDDVLIVQQQTFRNGVPGQYEFATVQSVGADHINLVGGLGNNYYSDSATDDGYESTRTQIIKVPQYSSVTLNSGFSILAKHWDGHSGGIVCFKCNGTFTGSGDVDVVSSGFRGATGYRAGEGYWGYDPTNVHNQEYHSAGGGDYTFGGGGGHRTIGNSTWAGAAYGTDDNLTLTLGGGGGGYNYGGGGAGAGAILIFSVSEIDNRIVFSAGGVDGGAGGNGGPGQGAAGKVIINATFNGTVDVEGGHGSNGALDSGDGYYINGTIPPPIFQILYKSIDSLDWAQIQNKPTSEPADIDDAVLLKHRELTWKVAVNGETIQDRTGYFIDASASTITLNLEVPTSDLSFRFAYRVIDNTNLITIHTNGAKWEGQTLLNDDLDITQNNVSGKPIYHSVARGWTETDLA